MSRHLTEELRGALNATKRRFAPSELFVAGDTSFLALSKVAIVGTQASLDDLMRMLPEQSSAEQCGARSSGVAAPTR